MHRKKRESLYIYIYTYIYSIILKLYSIALGLCSFYPFYHPQAPFYPFYHPRAPFYPFHHPSCNRQSCAAPAARFLLQFEVLPAETFKTLSWQSTLPERAGSAPGSQAPFSTLKASHIRPWPARLPNCRTYTLLLIGL